MSSAPLFSIAAIVLYSFHHPIGATVSLVCALVVGKMEGWSVRIL